MRFDPVCMFLNVSFSVYKIQEKENLHATNERFQRETICTIDYKWRFLLVFFTKRTPLSFGKLIFVITRFAPSPTGRLHLGHAYAALWADRAAGIEGQFLLRIEDIDHTRCRIEYEAGIQEDLVWLGLCWAEPSFRQSERLEYYYAALNRLEKEGLLYPCFCTRADINAEIAAIGSAPQAQGKAVGINRPEEGLYPGRCRRLTTRQISEFRAAGRPFALRLRMDRAVLRTGTLFWEDRRAGRQQAEPTRFGDIVLARKEIPTSYHLAVTLDDAAQGVTLVTRGMDLFDSTHIHRLLQALLDLPVPCWEHHPLLCDAQGERLAKRNRSMTLEALRNSGVTPQMVRRMIGFGDAV